MTAKPILFSGPMVQAILDGRKSQTRRIFKARCECGGECEPQEISATTPEGWQTVGHSGRWWCAGCTSGEQACPYGKPGDLLWVRERVSMSRITRGDLRIPTHKDADGQAWLLSYPAGTDEEFLVALRLVMKKAWDAPPVVRLFTSPIFMPRWASRITLEVANVRVERLQEISKEDVVAEGIDFWDQALVARDYSRKGAWFQSWSDGEGYTNYVPMDEIGRASYRTFWNTINAKRGYGWESNPWVWLVEFRRVNP